eukprot:TRINITY_DN655_c0_g1_i2.p4 TRINITY_DN655_c0_g1~~TRINITY_DN655_c0_g1_i2.p4  ORF type:complete len:56 (+),score=9.00 TRINITY_DN655_c0_g1_i2:292-459(+)
MGSPGDGKKYFWGALCGACHHLQQLLGGRWTAQLPAAKFDVRVRQNEKRMASDTE